MSLNCFVLIVFFFPLWVPPLPSIWVFISAVTDALMAPAQYPECSGTRNLHDNLSDLRAQVAANQRGSQLVGELIDHYGLAVVQAYMGYIQVATKGNAIKAKQSLLVLLYYSLYVNVSEQCRAGSERHAERLCTS